MRRCAILFLSVACILTSVCCYAQPANTVKTLPRSETIAPRYIPKLHGK